MLRSATEHLSRSARLPDECIICLVVHVLNNVLPRRVQHRSITRGVSKRPHPSALQSMHRGAHTFQTSAYPNDPNVHLGACVEEQMPSRCEARTEKCASYTNTSHASECCASPARAHLLGCTIPDACIGAHTFQEMIYRQKS